MSLNALGNNLARPDGRIARKRGTAPVARGMAPNDQLVQLDEIVIPQGGSEDELKGAATALDALSKFIPTEMLAPYVGALSLAVTQGWNARMIYWYFVVSTPLVFLLFSFAKQAIDQKPWPPLAPLAWRALAATFAFAVWGLSVPTNPLQATIGGAAVAGFFALIVSPILWATDAIALRLLGAGPTS